jgi:hypothetical protein
VKEKKSQTQIEGEEKREERVEVREKNMEHTGKNKRKS